MFHFTHLLKSSFLLLASWALLLMGRHVDTGVAHASALTATKAHIDVDH